MSLCLLQGIVPNFSALLFLTSQCLELERLLNLVLNQQGIGLFKFICGLELIALRFRSLDSLAPAGMHSAALMGADRHSIEQAVSQSFHRLYVKAIWHRIMGAMQMFRLHSRLLMLWFAIGSPLKFLKVLLSQPPVVQSSSAETMCCK